MDAAVIAPFGSTVRDRAFQPGFRLRVMVEDEALPDTAVRVGVTVCVGVTVGVEVAVDVDVAVAVGVDVGVLVGTIVGHVGAVVGTAPFGVAVAVFDAAVNETKRFRTRMPPGRFGEVSVTSTTPVPDAVDDRAKKVIRPEVEVVPHIGLRATGLVPEALTVKEAPVSAAFVQSTAATVIAVSIEVGRLIGVGLAVTPALPAEGLMPTVTPEDVRRSSERSVPTYPVNDEAREVVLEIEMVVTERLPEASASRAGLTRSVAARK